ncbi:uncharacterized protein LOC130989665 [Salvia miltiorrhiza]|uniref:uncharacterized protein LOC130989665 n=1 Tax=Salvia miltiorrhiza TaxID=226208 RepID=UPI0025AD91DC|nr:uncharacterized protein LOC130989665 [Salvia miltiorrhiza]
MLQRQIMFKQLQEMQRRQQLQELGGASNHDYVDQLTSSKKPSAVQLSSTVNRAPIRDPRMLMYDNMQMVQQGESGIFQGFPSGLVPSQGMSPPQFDMSIYGNPGPNADMNLNQYPYAQDPSNFSANLSTKSNSIPLGMSPVHPSATASSFMNLQGSFSADQSTVSDGSLLSCQVFQEKNLFGQVPFHNSSSNPFPVNYSPQGITTQRSTTEGRLEVEDTGWPAYSPGEVSKVDMSEASATLDPLEQKILYGSDDRGWLSSFGASDEKGAGDFECTVENPSFGDTLPSIQCGSWSALMQSAVTETSSSDTVVQEEWSELSFQNPEPSSDNQPSNLSNGENLQDNWVDRNLQNVSSPSSEPEQLFPRLDMKGSFPGFQHSGKQFRKQKDESQCESSHISGQCSTDYNSQLKHPTGRNQLVQTSFLSENTRTPRYEENSKTGHELQDTLWHSNPVSGGFQMPFGQLNQPNYNRYSVESEKMGPKDNVDPLSVGASDLYSQNTAAQSILTNSQEFGFRLGPADSRPPQSYSLFPSSPMGNLNVKSLPNSYEKDYIKNQHPTPSVPSFMSRINASPSGPRFSLSENVAVTQPSGTSVSSQRAGFLTGFPSPGADVTTQQDTSSPRANKFSSSLFRTPGSASSSLETTSRAPEQSSLDWSKHKYNVGYDEQKKASFLPESSTEIHNPTPLSSNTDSKQSLRKYSEVDGVASGSYMRHTSPQPYDQVEKKDIESPIFSISDSRAFGHPLQKNLSLLHQFHRPSPRDGQTDPGKRFPFNYQSTTANSRELLLSGLSVSVKDKAVAFSPGNVMGTFTKEADDQPAKASSTDYLRSSQQTEMIRQNESQGQSIDKEASAVAYQSQISLQMAPSWIKQHGNLKNFEAIPAYNQKAATTAMPPFSELSTGNLPENRLDLQVDSTNAAQGSGTRPSSAGTLIASKPLSPPSMLPSDLSYQHLSVSKLGKRKIVALDLEPWHKEVNSEAPRPQNISMAEFEWAQALNRRQEEARNEADIVANVLPVVRAKRRLIVTTQLMQQVFRPAVKGIIFGDASSNCDYLAYSAARTTLGDACNLNSKTPSDSNDVSPDKLNTSKRTIPSDFSKIVECLISQAEKLEGDLSRLDRSLSVVDIKVESQELEKFSTLNRFAKFHFKAHVDPTSSSGPSTVQKTTPQRYVTASPMPKILPEDTECISL